MANDDFDSTQIDESARRRFELELRDNPAIDLVDFLPDEGTAEYAGTLRELVIIDMESRWSPERNGPLVEWYMQRFSELAQPNVLAILLEEECRARMAAGDLPTLNEYQTRFESINVTDTDLEQIISEVSSDVAQMKTMQHPQAPPLTSLGDYRILREIGRGGMGVVYEAEQVVFGRRVALKVLPQDTLSNSDLVARFEREARAAANLHHTNIVPVFGVGHDANHHFYAMQFIQGQGLDRAIKELRELRNRQQTDADRLLTPEASQSLEKDSVPLARPRLAGDLVQTVIEDELFDPNETAIDASNIVPTSTDDEISSDNATNSTSSIFLGNDNDSRIASHRRTLWYAVTRIGIQAADGLDYAHRRGILHRDIKPANLILDEKGIVWIADFGLARIESEENLTRTGDVMGTLRYMPPEALEGKSDNRSDIFSLGLTLYELLCLKPGYDEGDRNRLIQRITDASVTSISEVETSIPRDLETIVHKCIDREPSGRYQTAGALRDDLERFLNDEPIQARRISGWEHLRRWARKNKGVAASLLTIVGLLLTAAVVSSVFAARFNQLATEKEDERLAAVAATDLADQRKIAAEEKEAEARVAQDGERRRRREADEQRDHATALAEANGEQLYCSQMLTAGATMNLTSGTGYVRQVLANWENSDSGSDLRGWEWYYLHGLCNGADSIFTADRLMGGNFVHWSNDEKSVWFLTDPNRRIIEFDVDREVATRVITPDSRIESAAWSHDEERVAVGCFDRTVRIYTWPGWELLVSKQVDDVISTIAWSADQKWLACGASTLGQVTVHNTETGDPVTTLSQTPFNPAVAFHPKLSQLGYCNSHNYSTTIIEVPSGREISTFPTEDGLVSSIAWSPDGDWVATKYDSGLSILDAASGDSVANFDIRGFARTMTWNGDGALAVGARDGTVYIVDPDSGKVTYRMRGHNWWVESIDWSPRDNRLVSVGPFDRPRIWSPSGLPDDKRIPTPFYTSASWSADSRELVVSAGNTLKFVDVDLFGLKKTRQVTVPAAQVLIGARWSPDGETVACLDRHGQVSLIDPSSERILRSLNERSPVLLDGVDLIDRIDWSHDSSQLLAITRNDQITVWDLRNQQSIELSVEPDEHVITASFHPEGSHVVAGTSKQARVWDLSTGRSRKVLHGWTNGIGWSHDGARLITSECLGYQAYGVFLIHPRQRGADTAFRGATRTSFCFDWSSDGERLAAGCADGTVCVWDVRTRMLVARFEDFSARCLGVRWSPDGTRLACVTHGEIIVKDARPGMDAANHPSALRRKLREIRTTGIDHKKEQPRLTRRFLNPNVVDEFIQMLKSSSADANDVASIELALAQALIFRSELRRSSGNSDNADDDSDVALRLLSNLVNRDPDDAKATEQWAMLRLAQMDRWTILRTSTKVSSEGVKIVSDDRGFVDIGAPSPLHCKVTLEFPCPPGKITAIRFEVPPGVPVPDFVKETQSFQLNDVTFNIAVKKHGAFEALPASAMQVNMCDPRRSSPHSIVSGESSSTTLWTPLEGSLDEPHIAVFTVPATEIGPAGGTLRITMQFDGIDNMIFYAFEKLRVSTTSSTNDSAELVQRSVVPLLRKSTPVRAAAALTLLGELQKAIRMLMTEIVTESWRIENVPDDVELLRFKEAAEP